MRICQRGHELEPETTYMRSNGTRTCKMCKQAYDREYYPRNLGKRKASAHEQYQRNLEKRKAYAREYYQRNLEKRKAYKRAYYEQHRKDPSEI